MEEIVNAGTAHDVRMLQAVTDTRWPLAKQQETAPLRAGSALIYSHNTFHRGNHRRDDWRTWRNNPRFMWRFWLYRTTDPPRHFASRGRDAAAGSTAGEMSWSGVDPMTGANLFEVTDDLTVIWRHHYHWLRTGEAPPPRAEIAAASPEEREIEAARLFDQLHAKYDAAEPARIGAAYKLASIGDDTLAVRLLGKALYTERESVRRAATFGLIALGPAATDTFLLAARSPVKWVRKAGVHGLGDASPLTEAVLDVVTTRLLDDPSVYVRSVAAGSLWTLVIICSHGAAALGTALQPAIAALQDVIRTDRNVFSVGFAMDALSRLVNLSRGDAEALSTVRDAREALPALLRASPIQPWEALVPGGMSAAALAAL